MTLLACAPQGPWEDEAMMRTYVQSLDAFADSRCNYSDLVMGLEVPCCSQEEV